MHKNLIVYFSRKGMNYSNGSIVDLKIGNSEVAAKMLNDMIDSTLFKVETVHSYATDYNECTKEAAREKKANARPKILDYVHQFNQYDNIFILYPNWWSTMPMAMFTFLESHDTSGKNIIPLCTHEGSGLGNSERDIKKLCPKANVLKGLAIRGSAVNSAKGTIKNWLEELNMEVK